MIRRMVRGLLLSGLLCAGAAVSLHAQEWPFEIVLRGNLTTRSQVYPNTGADDPVLRDQSFSVSDLFGYGAEVRYHFPESNVAIGISAEYIRGAESREILAFPRGAIPAEDGYKVIPVELTGYFFIPASGPVFGVFMGGGLGYYRGELIRSIAGVDAAVLENRAGVGIHVLGGVSYRFTERIAVNAEMKFRDVQFGSTSAFTVPRIIYQGAVVPLPQNPTDSSIHTDGVVFELGIAYGF